MTALASMGHPAVMPTPRAGWAFTSVGVAVEEGVVAVFEGSDKVPKGSGLIDVAKIGRHCCDLV